MYYDESVEVIKKRLNTNERGLTGQEASKRLKQNGKNEIPKPPSPTLINIFAKQLKSPIVIILMIATIFSIITKSYQDAIFIFAVIVINAVIGTYQEWSSQKSAEKLQEMIKIKSTVIRENQEQKIDSKNIVVGDVVVLESGDKIPADIRLFETNALSVDESILTGESTSKDKSEEINESGKFVSERSNIGYAGTIVTKGRGKGFAINVGENTEFGKIADKVLTTEDSKSPLVIRVEKFIKQISIFFMILAIALSALLYAKGYGMQEIFQNVIALTVSAIPEGLTIAMTIVLSVASVKMAKKNVIVKKLDSAQSLGSCSVIATDKTGTLTVNEQTAKKIVLPTGEEAYIKGTGYNDVGEVILSPNIQGSEKSNIKEIVKLGAINNEASLQEKNGKWVYHGDAIDIAFLALKCKMNVKVDLEIVGIVPYESKQKYSAVYYRENTNETYFSVKGGTEKVLEFCKYMKLKDKCVNIDKEHIAKQAEALAKQGYRIIAVANGKYEENASIENMTFLGLVAFVDPIRNDASNAVQTCKDAGIKVVMITGDHPTTANAIAKKIGIDDVYARVSPIQKLEIVEKLKADGEFVAVTRRWRK